MSSKRWIELSHAVAANADNKKNVEKKRSKKRGTVLISSAAAALLWALTAGNALADCFDDAAHYHNVNPWILRAIAARESGFKPTTISRNTNNTEDIGIAGTNSVHLPELARYGVSRDDLLDSCKAMYVAGWQLSKKIKKHGNTWKAVGAYHSETPRFRDRYALIIQQIINFWISRGVMPRQ